ncbi:MAG: ATP-dependent Clp protease adapter ClpS [Bdellovibrionota bacterium]
MHQENEEHESDGAVAVDEAKPKLKRPQRYAVLLHNDDYTTMEFVLEVLEQFFNKSGPEAMQIMLKVHNEGKGIAGIYPHEIAETKADQVIQLARSRGFPLMCTIEQAN